MQMILGMFVFSIKTAVYDELQRSTAWRHPSNERVGDMPAYQFAGRGEDTITLNGTIAPQLGVPISVTALRVMGDTGNAFPLISGTGKVFGLYVIESLEEGQTHYLGNVARKIDFTIKLKQIQKPGTLISATVRALIGLLR